MGSSHGIDLYVSHNYNFCADRNVSYLAFNRHKNNLSAMVMGRWRDEIPPVFLKQNYVGSFFGGFIRWDFGPLTNDF